MKKIFVLLSAVLLLSACAKPKLNLPAQTSETVGLNSLFTMSQATDSMFVQDYILNPADIDSLTCGDSHMLVKFGADKSKVWLTQQDGALPFFNISFWVKGVPYSVPCRLTDKANFTFTFNPHGVHYNRVQIAGQMNNWVASMTPDLQLGADSLFSVNLYLSPGTYLYQMVLDGKQDADPSNPNKVPNGLGQFNSIMNVKGSIDSIPQILTDEAEDGEIKLYAKNSMKEVFAYWQNYRLPKQFVEVEGGKIEIKIPAEAKGLERSYLRVWAVNSFGVSNDILVPLDKGKVLKKASKLTRHDKYADIIYFAIIDRFKNGDKSNDHPLREPDVKPQVDFMGGDLAGIQQVIDSNYFNALGVNTLWISPVVQNPLDAWGYDSIGHTKFAGYHGYWPVLLTKVDYRFGTNQGFKNMVEDAHSHNLNVLLDFVANHVHKENPLYVQHPEYATSMYLPDGRLNLQLWDEERLTTWFDTFLPSLDYSNPKVLNLMVDSAMFWIKNYDLDGFRQDACKHVDEAFWRKLTYDLKENDPKDNFYQIGETYGSPELIASYVNSGMLNGQFDFNVYDEASSAFNGVGGGTFTRLNNILKTSFKYYGHHNLMGYITGNQDKPRFMALASGDLKPGEDAKAAAWRRHIGVTDSTAYDKLALFTAFNMTIPGVPVIYYGDEIGMTGANDPDCRRMMRFENLNPREKALYKKISELAHLRRSHLEFVYGDFINLAVMPNTWVYARKYFKQEAIVIINNQNKTATFDVDFPKVLKSNDYKAMFKQRFKIKHKHLHMELPPYGLEILYTGK